MSESATQQRLSQPDGKEDGGDSPGDLVRRAASGDKTVKAMSDGERHDAMQWFLSTDSVDISHTFQINVGSVESKHWIDWTVGPVDLDQLRRIRQQSSGSSRAQRRSGSGDFDEVQANLQIVVEGTLKPDLKDIAGKLSLADPRDALRRKFAHKPGLLTQIAGEVMSISGYDDEDVREVQGAKNS